jgi:NAD(P)H-dependent flavin oxidoreductase YrpB (nitropropane dioxygenase family)
MKAKETKNLNSASQPFSSLNEEQKRRRINTAHAEALKLNAQYDAWYGHKPQGQKARYFNRELICRKKKKYVTADAAIEDAAKFISKRGRSRFLRAYECWVCNKWHLSSKKLREK